MKGTRTGRRRRKGGVDVNVPLPIGMEVGTDGGLATEGASNRSSEPSTGHEDGPLAAPVQPPACAPRGPADGPCSESQSQRRSLACDASSGPTPVEGVEAAPASHAAGELGEADDMGLSASQAADSLGMKRGDVQEAADEGSEGKDRCT